MPKKPGKKKDMATEALRQVAALPMRERDGHLEVCLVTTRSTGRWTVPKGWPMKRHEDFVAARIEAEQEAGATGKPSKKPIGSFLYWTRREHHFDLVRVALYPLAETHALPDFKEQGQRKVAWVDPADATIVVDEPGLAGLLQKIAGQPG